MGRELRRVIPNWEHPTKEVTRYSGGICFSEKTYKPMFDRDYLKDLEEWIEGHRKWEAGEDEYRKEYPEYRYYAQWEGDPPNVEYYRPPWSKEEATWYQGE